MLKAVLTPEIPLFGSLEDVNKGHYYQYEFLDLASFQALRAFELALRKRIEELQPTRSGRKDTMKDLIEWFSERGYFETNNTVS